MPKRFRKLTLDLAIFLASCFLAYLLIQNGHLEAFINKVIPIEFLAEFISGFFFTSFLTTPFSLAIFYVLSGTTHPIQIALIGGLGACVGDMLIVSIFRNSFFDDFQTIEKILKLKRTFYFFKHSHFNHLAPLLGILIIASPFPDELGLMMLGASKVKTLQLALLTFIINTAGIFLIVSGVKLL